MLQLTLLKDTKSLISLQIKRAAKNKQPIEYIVLRNVLCLFLSYKLHPPTKNDLNGWMDLDRWDTPRERKRLLEQIQVIFYSFLSSSEICFLSQIPTNTDINREQEICCFRIEQHNFFNNSLPYQYIFMYATINLKTQLPNRPPNLYPSKP